MNHVRVSSKKYLAMAILNAYGSCDDTMITLGTTKYKIKPNDMYYSKKTSPTLRALRKEKAGYFKNDNF